MLKKKPDSSEIKLQRVAMLSLNVGVTVAITALAFVFLGKWIDEKFHTQPFGFLVFIILGLIVSVFLVWQIVKPLWEQLDK